MSGVRHSKCHASPRCLLLLLLLRPGALHWSHLLFTRVKQTMAKLQAAQPDGAWRDHAVGQQVNRQLGFFWLGAVSCSSRACG